MAHRLMTAGAVSRAAFADSRQNAYRECDAYFSNPWRGSFLPAGWLTYHQCGARPRFRLL